MNRRYISFMLGMLLLCILASSLNAAGKKVVIRTHTLTATIQDGRLAKLVNNLTGSVLVSSKNTGSAPAITSDGSADTSWSCKMLSRTKNSVNYMITGNRGTKIKVYWGTEARTGDIVLRMRVDSQVKISRFSFPVDGIDISKYKAVLPSNFGDCEVVQAPQTGKFASEDTSQMAVSLFLFEGENDSWTINYNDGDELDKGFEIEAKDTIADSRIVRKLENPSGSFVMFPVRFQACKGSWHTLADRFAREWLVKKLEFSPLAQQPQWIRNIRASVGFNDFVSLKPELLDDLAEKLIPSQTLLYTPVWRTNAMDFNYPDYTPSESFIAWCKRARELGFHVCAHFNAYAVNKGMNDYLEKFRPGMNPVYPGWGVKDPETGFLMWSLDGGRSGHYYVSPCYKPWRDFYLQAVKPAIEAGADVIHLDESHTPMTCPVENRDIVNIRLANVAFHQMLKTTYPQVALQEEAYNDVNTRFSSFAQDTGTAKHNLVRYIFSKFVKFVTRPGAGDLNTSRDGYESIGVKLPWGQYPLTDGVMEEMRAFQDYELEPAPNMKKLPHQKAAFTGKGKTTAFLENDGKTRGLAVYLPDGTIKRFNTLYSGSSEYEGLMLPGWLVYNDRKIMGLDPNTPYRLTAGVMAQDSFHIDQIPDDFTLARGISGLDRDYYIAEFTAKGEVQAYIPSDLTEVYVNGAKFTAQSNKLRFTANGKTFLVAYKTADVLKPGRLNEMNWAIDGKAIRESDPMFLQRLEGFFHHAGARAHVIGILPDKPNLKLNGTFGIDAHAKNGMAARILINGKEIVNIDLTKYPWEPKAFSVDISEFAGKKAIVQLETDGTGGYNYGGWNSLTID